MAVQRVKNSKGEWVIVSGGGGGSGAVDSAMSDTSTNAVQNRVIKNYVDSYYPKDFDLSEFESEDFF